MKRTARIQIDYRDKEQENNFVNGDRSASYNSIMPGQEVPAELVPTIVANNPEWLEPKSIELVEASPNGPKVTIVKKKGHGLDKKEIESLNKSEQLKMLLDYGKLNDEDLKKMGIKTEEQRVKKLLEFA